MKLFDKKSVKTVEEIDSSSPSWLKYSLPIKTEMENGEVLEIRYTTHDGAIDTVTLIERGLLYKAFQQLKGWLFRGI